ncbi:MAG: RagB/SusD family nutrient uptake outer membrane protein [Prevotella sp.]|nr:RagB/SusD family nutrient uptake outer membrane protein [Prevotella sp.]
MIRHNHPFRIADCLFLTVALLLVSCDSFLDDQPRGYSIPETTENYEGMFNTSGFMTVMCEDYTKFLSPHILLTPENVTNLYRVAYRNDPASSQRAFQFETRIYDTAENCQLWAYIYQKIYIFNSIIDGVMDSDGATEQEKRAVQAEARVGRAWLHFILAQAFSKPYNADTPDEPTIPIVRKADTYAENFKRASMRELYDFITNEMDEAVPQMKDLPVHRYRAYKTTGLALQGKIYWLIGNYEKALEPLREAFQRMKVDKDVSYMRNYNTLLANVYGNRELTVNELYGENKTTGACLLPYAWLIHKRHGLNKTLSSVEHLGFHTIMQFPTI